VCPRTGLTDFGTITIHCVPDKKRIELKALKYYFPDYRNHAVFYGTVVNEILDDLVAVCDPVRLEVIGSFSTRGGISTVLKATYEKGNEQ
jgi:7-cyano-7-deazaguanine reductase